MQKSPNSSLLYISNFYQVSLEMVKNLGPREEITEELYQLYVYNQYYFFGILSQFRATKTDFFIYCPFPIDGIYLQYLSELFNIPKQNMHVLLAKIDLNSHIGNICQHLLEDEQNLSQIQDFDCVCQCNSIEMFRLRDFLKDKANFIQGVSVQSWEKMKNYGTKSGLRELVQNLGDQNIKMPKGKIFYNSKDSYNEAVEYLIEKLEKQSAVAKIDQGYAGRGVVIFLKSDIEGMEKDKIKEFIQNKLSEPFWKVFHIIVEDLICFQGQKSKNIPYCLMRINDNQQLQTLAIIGMIQDQIFVSVGFEIGKGVVKETEAEKIRYASQRIGQIYLKTGYRGYFDVDFIIDSEGSVFITQSNVRRDDGLPIHSFAYSMYGAQYYKNRYIMSYYLQVENLKATDFTKIYEETKRNSLNFTREKGGIAFTGINPFQINQIQFAVISESKAEAFKMVEKLKQICQCLK